MANLPKSPPFHHQFLAPLSRPFYSFTKRIYEQSSLPVSSRFLHLLECIALLLHFLHLSSLVIQVNYGSQFWDPLVPYFASQLRLYDRYMFACLVCLILYTLITNWQLFLRQSKETNRIPWQAAAYDLTVRNVDQACKCRRIAEFNPENSKLRPLRLIYHGIKSNLLQEHLDLEQLQHPRHQLAIFSFLSANTRKKLLQFQFISNLIVILIPFILLLPLQFGLTLHLLSGVQATNLQICSLPGFLLLFLEITLFWIMGYLILRNALLLLYYGMALSLATRWHLQSVHRLLTFFKVKYGSRPLQRLNTWNRLLLGNILREHAQLCALLDTTNRQIISLAVLSGFALHAPTNIYLIYRLIYRRILLTEITPILCFTFGQLLILAGSVVPLAQANGSVYRTGKYLPAIQLYVLRGGNNRSLKLKYENLQSTLTESRVKSGATIGPLCLITFESLFQFVSLYVVYMLAFFVLLPK